jgi:hypothetical protein
MLARASKSPAVSCFRPRWRRFSSTGRFHCLSKFSDAVLEKPFRRTVLDSVDSLLPAEPEQAVPAALL